MSEFFIGLDLGQVQDYTAIAVVEYLGNQYHVRHLERLKLGTPYPEVADHVSSLIGRLKDSTSRLVVDATGVGKPVVDLLKQKGLYPVAITITGGDSVVQVDSRNWRVPKRDLVSNLQVLLQTRQLKVAGGLDLASVLVQELLAFKVKIDLKTAHDSYSAWREGAHDDLVLATALACWWASNRPVRPYVPLIVKRL